MNRIVAAALPLLAAFSALSLTPPLAAQTAVTSAAANLTLGFIDSAIAERRLKSAVELIRAAEARNPGPELELRKAELLLAAGALDEAQTAFQKLEADAAVAARAKVGRSIALLNAGHPNQADTLLAEALALDPSMVRGWSARGVLADRRGDWKSAEASYAQGLAADPKSATLLNNRGYSRLLQGRNPEAEADFMAALAIQPGMEAAATNLRLARGLQGRYAEAFDVDWVAGDGKLIIPILGDGPEELAELTVSDDGTELRYYDHRFPVAPGTGSVTAWQVHDRQHYVLVNYRRADTDLNYRRFFAINTLAAVRVEDPTSEPAQRASPKKVLKIRRQL